MYPPLTPAQSSAYNRTLVGLSTKRVRVLLTDRTGQPVEDLTRNLIDGDVNIDSRADVTRSTTLEILDPRHRFGFDADTYQGGDLDLSRMVRVWWSTDGPLMGAHVTVPIFTGPITRLTRRGPVVSIEGQGKEVYGLVRGSRTVTIKQGTRKTEAIRTILQARMGESRLVIPDLAPRISAVLVVRPKDQPWKIAQKLAQSMGKQLFYDGGGVCRLRELPGRLSWTFRGGADNQRGLLSELETSADLAEVINQVRVTGRTPKNKKQPVVGTATADPAHPLSPQRLGPPGAPMYLQEEVQNDQCRTVAECLKLARTKLDRGLNLTREVAFDAVPIPFLEPLDRIAVDTEFEHVTARLETASIPLGLNGAMSVGYDGPYALHKIRAQKRKNKQRGTGQGHGRGQGNRGHRDSAQAVNF